MRRTKRFDPEGSPALSGREEARKLLAAFLAAASAATFSVAAAGEAAAQEPRPVPASGGATFEAAVASGAPALTLDQLKAAGELAFVPTKMVSREYQERRAEAFRASITGGGMLASVPLPDAMIAGVGGDELAAAYEDELSGSDDSAIPAPETEPGAEYASKGPEENADEPLKASEQPGDLPFRTGSLGGEPASPDEIAASSPEDYVPEESRQDPSVYEDDLAEMGVPEEEPTMDEPSGEDYELASYPPAEEEANDGGYVEPPDDPDTGEEDVGLSQQPVDDAGSFEDGYQDGFADSGAPDQNGERPENASEELAQAPPQTEQQAQDDTGTPQEQPLEDPSGENTSDGSTDAGQDVEEATDLYVSGGDPELLEQTIQEEVLQRTGPDDRSARDDSPVGPAEDGGQAGEQQPAEPPAEEGTEPAGQQGDEAPPPGQDARQPGTQPENDGDQPPADGGVQPPAAEDQQPEGPVGGAGREIPEGPTRETGAPEKDRSGPQATPNKKDGGKGHAPNLGTLEREVPEDGTPAAPDVGATDGTEQAVDDWMEGRGSDPTEAILREMRDEVASPSLVARVKEKIKSLKKAEPGSAMPRPQDGSAGPFVPEERAFGLSGEETTRRAAVPEQAPGDDSPFASEAQPEREAGVPEKTPTDVPASSRRPSGDAFGLQPEGRVRKDPAPAPARERGSEPAEPPGTEKDDEPQGKPRIRVRPEGDLYVVERVLPGDRVEEIHRGARSFRQALAVGVAAGGAPSDELKLSRKELAEARQRLAEARGETRQRVAASQREAERTISEAQDAAPDPAEASPGAEPRPAPQAQDSVVSERQAPAPGFVREQVRIQETYRPPAEQQQQVWRPAPQTRQAPQQVQQPIRQVTPQRVQQPVQEPAPRQVQQAAPQQVQQAAPRPVQQVVPQQGYGQQAAPQPALQTAPQQAAPQQTAPQQQGYSVQSTNTGGGTNRVVVNNRSGGSKWKQGGS